MQGGQLCAELIGYVLRVLRGPWAPRCVLDTPLIAFEKIVNTPCLHQPRHGNIYRPVRVCRASASP